MYTQDELKTFIANPPDHIDVDFVVEMAKQLLQEKQVTQDLQRVLNSVKEPPCPLHNVMDELQQQWQKDVDSGYPKPEALWQMTYSEHDAWCECHSSPDFGDSYWKYRRCKDADDLIAEWQASQGATSPSYYHRQFNGKSIDVYDVLVLWDATNPCQQHAIKKLLRAGQSIKPLRQDVEETIGTLNRWLEMMEEDNNG
jgi:hypothetical protein